MTASQSDTPAGTSRDTPADPQREVEELRTELGDTVQELAHRVDVPSRMREKRAETAERVQAQVSHAREVVAERAPEAQAALRERPALVAGIGAVLGFLVLRALRQRLRTRKIRKEDADGTR
ncbi:DUF3618 domain-containing protein [Pseudonocardia sp. MH-G8]|uniref:DUF3618 domain-containing protein n=1 Tax=Pseudonocardia sp. MH-G8 TaxID=1854588 RepID=UPI000B9FE335|nr:DUF3618 domain-containing protein [Pseudonocardia sp. MH-G8]OZM81536.1 hypothetical protein CFP66_15550 [Pseudonocardia sp. MH-G8]